MKSFEYNSDFFLFHGLCANELDVLRAKYPGTVKRFANGDTVSAPSDFRREIGVILSGGCTVTREKSDERDSMPMNQLLPGDFFGFLSVLTDEETMPTTIRAKSKTSILFYSRDEMLGMMNDFPAVAINTAKYLAGRVTFLNRKIAPFSCKDAAAKLAAHLVCKSNASGNVIPFTPTVAARELNIGRASLYRAINALESDGAISFADRKITVLDSDQLERISQK